MALIAPPARESFPGFPPRGGMTFGEVVSSYNMFGNSAAKRRNYMVHHQETHLPDDRCTIRDKVRLLEKDKDPLKSFSSSSRGLLTPRWSTTRSRTPSPWAARRPRSLPGTPRASTPSGLRPSFSRDRFLKDPMDAGIDDYLGERLASYAVYDSRFDGLPQSTERSRYGGSAYDTFAVDHTIPDTFAVGADGNRGSGAASNFPTTFPSAPAASAGVQAGTRPSSLSAEAAGNVGAGVPPPRTPPILSKGSAYDRLGNRGGPGGSLVHLGYASEGSAKPQQADARAASFIRLNSFLLRTHVTSLVSALAEDGWLETWEKERLCSQAREDSQAWSQTFFRSYMRFLEIEDVPTFVASLRSQIV